MKKIIAAIVLVLSMNISVQAAGTSDLKDWLETAKIHGSCKAMSLVAGQALKDDNYEAMYIVAKAHLMFSAQYGQTSDSMRTICKDLDISYAAQMAKLDELIAAE